MAIGRKRIIPIGLTGSESVNIYEYVASGGIKTSGTASTSLYNGTTQYTTIASGGNKLGGSATTENQNYYNYSSLGGLLISSSSINTKNKNYLVSGGIKASGSATTLIEEYHVVYTYVPGIPGDANWSSVVLLLHCEGTNGSNSFIDSSQYNRSVTAVGSAQISTNYYKYGTGSGYFSGLDSRYLQLDGSSDFAFGISDFTIEFWVKLSYNPGPIYDSRPSGTDNGAYPCIITDGNNYIAYYVNDTIVIQGNTTFDNNWHHIAVSRISGITKLFKDGVQEGSSWSDSTNYINGVNRPLLAGNGAYPTSYATLWGHLDEIRITKGVGRYSSNFTVPDSAFLEAPSIDTFVSGTASLSTIPVKYIFYPNGDRILFSSNTDLDIVKSYVVNELLPYDIYWQYVDFLAHFDVSLYLDSSYNYYINQYGGGTLSTSSKFGTNCWKAHSSNYSYFYVNVGTEYQFGSDDWTIEAWINHFNTPVGYQGYLIYRRVGNSQIWIYQQDGYIQAYLLDFNGGGPTSLIYEVGLDIGKWHHIALERYGNTIGLYYDGNLVDTAEFIGTLNIASSSTIYFNGITGYSFRAYIDEVRITKGVARYLTTSFIPPSSPYPEDYIPIETSLYLDGLAEVRDNNYDTEIDGGPKLNGRAIFSKTKTYVSTDSIVRLGGYAQSIGRFSVVITGSGSLILESTSQYYKLLRLFYESSGELLLSGQAATTGSNAPIREYVVSGSIFISSSANFSFKDVLVEYIASGGLSIEGGTSNLIPPRGISFNGTGILSRELPLIYTGTSEYITRKFHDDYVWLKADINGYEGQQWTYAIKFVANTEGPLWQIVLPVLRPLNNPSYYDNYGIALDIVVKEIDEGTGIGSVIDFSTFSEIFYEDKVWLRYEHNSDILTDGNIHKLVLQFDSSQINLADRLKIFIDGNEWSITNKYGLIGVSSDITLIYDFISYGEASPIHYIGSSSNEEVNGDFPYYGIWWWDGDTIDIDIYEVIFVSESIISYELLWNSLVYSGTYGNIGYHLKFNNPGNIGFDSSFNNNNFSNGGVFNSYIPQGGSFTKEIDIGSDKAFAIAANIYIDTNHTINNEILYIVEDIYSLFGNEGNFKNNLHIGLKSNGAIFIKYVHNDIVVWEGLSSETITKGQEIFISVNVDTSQVSGTNRVIATIDGVRINWANLTAPLKDSVIFGINAIEYPVISWGALLAGAGNYANNLVADAYNLLTFSDFIPNYYDINLNFLGPYGEYGTRLEFNTLNFGNDSSGNNLDYIDTNIVSANSSSYDATYSISIGLGFEILLDATPIQNITLPLRLYSSTDISLSIILDLLIDPKEIVLGLKLYSSGTNVSITLPFILYNIESYGNEGFAYWQVYCLLNNTDVSNKLIDNIIIENEENSSCVVEFTYLPDSGIVDPPYFLGKIVEFYWRQYDNNNQLIFSKRRFKGVVSSVEWDPDRRIIKFMADTQLPAYFDTLEKVEIADIIGGLWSDRVWDNEDDATGWTYAQERLSTTENCIWHDENWNLHVNDFKAKRNGNEIIPDYIFTDSERFHETLNLEYAQRSEMINEIRCNIQYQYQRKRQKKIKVDWTQYGGGYAAGDAGIKTMLCGGNSFQICQRSMVEGAATGGDWVAVSQISYDPLWGPKAVYCGTGINDFIIWGVSIDNVFTPIQNKDGTYRKVVGSLTGLDGKSYKSFDLNPTSSQGTEFATPEAITNALCTGAHWFAARRWLQDVSENYEITVLAPDSIEVIGKVSKEEDYTIDANVDNGDWENSIEPYKDNSPTTGKLTYNNIDYWNSDEETDWATTETVTAIVGGYIELNYQNITSDFLVKYSSIVYEFGFSKVDSDSKNGWCDKITGILYIFSTAEQIAKGASRTILNGQSLTVSYKYADGAIVNREKFEDAQEVILAAAKGDILKAHRLTTVSFKVPYQPQLNLSHTVQIQTPYLIAAGKVKKLKDTWSIESGEASTEIFLAISRHNGNGLISSTDPLVAQDRPVPTGEETALPSRIILNNYIGGRTWGTKGFTGKWFDGRSNGTKNEETDEWIEEPWVGFMTNYESTLTSDEWAAYWSGPSELFNEAAWTSRLSVLDYIIPYQFVMKGPDIDETLTTSVSEPIVSNYNVAIPQDLLILIA